VAVIAKNSLYEAVERLTSWVGISTWTFVNNNRHTSSSTISSYHISISIFSNAINPMGQQFRRISQELQRRRMNHWKSHPCKSQERQMSKKVKLPS
jgi:predicted HAD superfamily phosphohydrolase YqeG